VHPTLQSRHARSTFVIGDAAQLPRAVAKQAYNAIDMGELRHAIFMEMGRDPLGNRC
jgi:NADH dehydrogenase FAD-containing subunit